MELEGKCALITGGSRGIGAALVEKFVAAGCDVGFTYRSSQEQAEALAKSFSAGGRKVKAYASDASDYNEAEALVQQFLTDFGKIDILINNAGITKDTLMLRMSEAQWDDVIHVNLKSVFNLTKHAIKPMIRAQNGVILNMSSVVGIFGNAGQANYAASKAGIIGFTKSIAKELGSRNVRCNAIAPGFIETDMTHQLDEKTKEGFLANIPLKRLAKADEVADLCIFLSSDRASYITGQTISICGGLNM